MSKEVKNRIELGQNVRRIREQKGLSQNELGVKSKIHRNYISDLERGERNISFEMLLKISDGLGVSLRQLLTKK